MSRLVGNKAPNFSLKAVSGNGESFLDISLNDYAGRWLVLFFYPLDFTFVCPTEITSISEQYDQFQNLNANILGISTDSIYSHQAWIRNGLGKINYPLGADKTLNIANKYGVLLEDEGIALRGTFIISPELEVKYAVIHDNNVGRSTEELLRVLTALQTDSLCGANWKVGSKTLEVTETHFEKKVLTNNSSDIKIYTLPNCSYCNETKKYFNENNLPYEEFNLEISKEGQAFMEKNKYSKLPITVINGEEIHGFRLDLIKELLEK